MRTGADGSGLALGVQRAGIFNNDETNRHPASADCNLRLPAISAASGSYTTQSLNSSTSTARVREPRDRGHRNQFVGGAQFRAGAPSCGQCEEVKAEFRQKDKRCREKLEKSRNENVVLQARLDELTASHLRQAEEVIFERTELERRLLEESDAAAAALRTVGLHEDTIQHLTKLLDNKDDLEKQLKTAVSLAEGRARQATGKLQGIEEMQEQQQEVLQRKTIEKVAAAVDEVKAETSKTISELSQQKELVERQLAEVDGSASQQLAESQKRYNEMEQKLAGSMAEIAVLQATAADARRRAEAAEARCEEQEQAVAQAGQRQQEQELRLAQLESEVAGLNQENASHLGSLQQTQQRLADAYALIEADKKKSEQVETLQERIVELERELLASREDCEKLEQNCSAMAQDTIKQVEEVKAQEATERARVLQQLMHSQVHVVVSAPCIKLVINHSKEQVYMAPPAEVNQKVKDLLEKDVLPQYVHIISSMPEAAAEVAEDRMKRFCDDVSAGINDQITAIVLEGAAGQT